MMTPTNCDRGGCLLLGIALALVQCPVLNAQESVSDRSPKRSFTSQDGLFRFIYSGSLVSCEKDPGQPDRWTPDESCQAVIPVCSDVSGNSDNTAACVAYPATRIERGTDFEAAAFSVNILTDANTDRACLSVAEPPPHVGTRHTETINGVKFSVTQTDGVAAGNLLDGYSYRSFHGKICYELDLRIAFSNIGNYDSASAKNFDLQEVRRSLKNVLVSFKFLK